MKDQKLFDRLKSHAQVLPNGCWEWQGAIGGSGYANTYLYGKYTNAHRAMWIAIHGPIKPGYSICHSCDNKLCVNPDHLFKATQEGNLADMTRKGRRANGPTLSNAMRKAWTPELRAKQAEKTGQRMRKIHELLAKDAGVPVEWKFCPSCKQWYPRSNFYRNRARHDGLKPHCKSCSIIKDVARQKHLASK